MTNQEYKNANMVCLYIFTHNITGLRYFGKTTNAFDIKSLLQYGGSGTYWKDHLKVHGKDLSVEIYGIFKISEVKDIALKFSADNNIVKELNESGNRKGKKIWANQKPEDGLNGGELSKETRDRIGLSHKNKVGVIDKDGNKFKVFIDNKKYLSGEYISYNTGLKQSQETVNKRVNKIKGMKRKPEVGVQISARQKGTNNPLYNPITIYNDKNTPIFTSLFRHPDNLKHYGIPKTILATLKNKSTMYNDANNKTLSYLKNNGNLKFKGWYVLYSKSQAS